MVPSFEPASCLSTDSREDASPLAIDAGGDVHGIALPHSLVFAYELSLAKPDTGTDTHRSVAVVWAGASPHTRVLYEALRRVPRLSWCGRCGRIQGLRARIFRGAYLAIPRPL